MATREAKFNLIFLIALLALSMPGMILLMRKALRGEGGLSSQPPDVAISTPYLHPVGTAPGVTRSTPPQTLAWVDEVSQARLGSPPTRDEAAGGRPVPIIGQERRVELLLDDSDAGEVAVLVWLHAKGEAVSDFEVELDGQRAQVVETELLEVPEGVRRELQAYGYPRPPLTATFLRIGDSPIPPPPADAAERTERVLRLTWSRGNLQRGDRLLLRPTGDNGRALTRSDAPAP